MAKEKDLTVKERLASVETLLETIDKGFSNHLAHHWAITITLLGVVAVEAVAFLVLVIKHVSS